MENYLQMPSSDSFAPCYPCFMSFENSGNHCIVALTCLVLFELHYLENQKFLF